jgi:hypothetical protein
MNPKSELASKLKDVLSKMSQEEFDKEWSKVTSLNLESPSFEEAIEFFSLMQSQLSHFELVSNQPATYTGESNYALAA